MSALVLAVSPAPSATAMALFRGLEPIRSQVVAHGEQVRNRAVDPRGVRTRAIREFLEGAEVVRGGLAAVAVHGGVLLPVEGGTYQLCDALLRDAERAGGEDPTNIGASIAHAIAAEWACQAYVVDPESVDERETLARVAQSCCLAVPHAPARTLPR